MVSLVITLLAAADVSVAVAPGTACVSREGLAARLERAGLVVSAERSSSLHVELTREGSFIVVRGVRRGTLLERKVAAGVDECAAVERVIAALIHSWAQAVPTMREPVARGASDGGPTADAEGRLATVNSSAEIDRAASAAAIALARRTTSGLALSDGGPGVVGRAGALTGEAATFDGTDGLSSLSSSRSAGAAVLARSDGGSRISGAAPDSAAITPSPRGRLDGLSASVAFAPVDAGSEIGAGVAAAKKGGLEVGVASAALGADAGGPIASNTTPLDAGVQSASTATNPDSSSASLGAGVQSASTATNTDSNSGPLDAGVRTASTASNTAFVAPNDGVLNTKLARAIDAGAATTLGAASTDEAPSASGPSRAGSVTSTSGGTTISLTPLVVVRSPGGPDAGVEASSANRLALDLSLLGGGAIGPTSAVTGAGQLGASLSFSRFGAALDLGLESQRTGTVEPASVDTSAQWASLSGFLHGAPLERLRLRVGAGLRGWRFAASSAGVLDAQSTQVFSFGGAVWADGSFRVVGPLSLQAALVGAARWRPERFLVTNLGPVLELSPFSATALIGVSIRGLGE